MGSVFPYVRLAYELAAAALAPPRCAACDAYVSLRAIFCGICAATLEPAPRQPCAERPACVAPFIYGGAVALAITRLKYERRSELGRPLAELVRLGVRQEAESCRGIDVVCPVPLHPSRLAERGFNQAALLAGPVARDLGARFIALALRRTRDTLRQATLDRTARERNVDGAFEVRRGSIERIRGARVLLVDDVRTTGATLDACEEALRASGARDVVQAVVARAERGT